MTYAAALITITQIALGVFLGTLGTAFLFKVIVDRMNQRRWVEREAQAKREAEQMYRDMQAQINQREAEERVKAAVEAFRRTKQN